MAGETKTRLTLLAEALGFDQSARAVDVLTKAQEELKKKSAELEGAKLTGTLSQFQQLTQEQRALQAAVSELTPAQKEQADATEQLSGEMAGLHVRQQDYVGLLNQIDPRLGAMAASMSRAGRIAGELAQTNLTLSGIFGNVTSAVQKFSGALGPIGAAGLAVAGISFLISQIQKIGEQAEKSREAMEKLKKAQTDLERGEIASVRDIVAERDKDRRQKPFTFEQEESVRKTFEAAPEGLRERLGPLLKQFGGAKGFGTAPGEFTASELEALAERGFEADAAVRPGMNVREARKFLRKEAAASARIDERQRREEEATRREAAQEAVLGSQAALEGQGHLEELVERAAKRRGVEPDRLRKIIDEEMRVKDIERRGGFVWADPYAAREEMRRDLTAPETEASDEIMRELNSVGGKSTGGQNVTIDNSTHNYTEAHRKMIVPGQRAQEAAMNNGAARARAAEE